ncbi:MAG: PspC domain-containing protein [Acidobacteria bacterium]|nr:PspC domain-containing protein [Acidobacteriota bacterium]
MFCTQCGVELQEKDNFCSKCGRATSNAPPPSGGYFARRRLSRPMRDKTIAGVCAGFARYLDIDVTLVRILWLCLAIFFGTGFLAYVIAWIVMPKDWEPAPATATAQQPT